MSLGSDTESSNAARRIEYLENHKDFSNLLSPSYEELMDEFLTVSPVPSPVVPTSFNEAHCSSEQVELTKHSESSSLRQPIVPPQQLPEGTFPAFAIPPHSTSTSNYTFDQDVFSVLNASRIAPTSVPAPRHGNPRHPAISTRNNALTKPNYPTPSRIYHSTEDLVAHHGIPAILPPPPRPTQPTTDTTTQSGIPDFNEIRNNYLSMLQQSSENANANAESAALTGAEEQMDFDAYFNLGDCSSPSDAGDMLIDTYPVDDGSISNAFLLSPPEETPLFDDSPIFGDSPFSPCLETPVMDMVSDYSHGTFGTAAPLFPETVASSSKSTLSAIPAGLYTMSPFSPDLNEPIASFAPMVAPQGVPSSAEQVSEIEAALDAELARNKATGTRKNLRPDHMIPENAPTQRRTYLTPSQTSRKEVPASVLKKRARSQAFDEDEDEADIEVDDDLKAQIEHKRRQNTIAARKSRRRKLARQLELEDAVSKLNEDLVKSNERVLLLEGMLRSHGIPPPVYASPS